MPRAVFLLDCFKISSFQQSNKRFYPIYIIPPLTARVKDVDEKLSWLQISQHQFQENVTHRLAFVLVDGRDDELNFADLIGVFLLAVTSSIASSTKLLAQSIPCFVSDCRGHVSTPKSRGYRKSNRELPFPAFGASFLRFFRLFLNFIHYTTKSLFWTFPYEKVAIPNWNSYFQSTYGN